MQGASIAIVSTLYVREVPDEVYEAIRRHARERRSSVSREAIRLLQRGLRMDRVEARGVLADLRDARPIVGAGRVDSAALIREDRDGR